VLARNVDANSEQSGFLLFLHFHIFDLTDTGSVKKPIEDMIQSERMEKGGGTSTHLGQYWLVEISHPTQEVPSICAITAFGGTPCMSSLGRRLIKGRRIKTITFITLTNNCQALFCRPSAKEILIATCLHLRSAQKIVHHIYPR
jgi:hypothetical protein